MNICLESADNDRCALSSNDCEGGVKIRLFRTEEIVLSPGDALLLADFLKRAAVVSLVKAEQKSKS